MEAIYQHWLLCNDDGESLLLENAPIGWDEQKFNLIRDLRYFGIFKKISVEYEFVGDGYRFLQNKQLRFGSDASVVLRVYKKNLFLFEGKINYLLFQDHRKTKQFKVDVLQSDLVQKFQTREDLKLNILNDISVDRQPVLPATLYNALFRGKKIQFFTKFEGSSLTSPQPYHHVVPFLLKVNGNPGATSAFGIDTDNNFSDPIQSDSNYPFAPNEIATFESAFYVNNLSEDQTLNIVWDMRFRSTYLGVGPPYNEGGGNGTNWFPQRRIIIRVYDADGAILSIPFENKTESSFGIFDLSGSHTIVVPPGGYATFTNEQTMRVHDIENDVDDFDDFLQPFTLIDNQLKTEYEYLSLNMTISQDSILSDTTTPVVLPHELFSNLFSQINGCEFYSEFFGRTDIGYDEDGKGALTSITTGRLLRGIPVSEIIIENGIQKEKKEQIPTSLRDAFTSYSALYCLGMVIQKNMVIVEPLENLFNDEIATHLGEVRDLINGPSQEYLFNSVLGGYPKNEYEQENGRDEFNTQAQYTNMLHCAKKELNLVSVYFGDGYGAEFARRLNVQFTGTQDSRYDDKIFLLDLVRDIDGNLMTRRQEGILLVEGIFSPETALNLNISLEQNMKRWNKFLSIPLDRKADKSYYFQTKDKNSNLHIVTEDQGETFAGQTITVSGRPQFIPEERNFETPITLDKLFEILANPLGRVAYTYEGEDFFDYLFEVDMETEKAKGPWRMLGTKASPVPINDALWLNILKYGDGPTDYVQYGLAPVDVVLYSTGDEVPVTPDGEEGFDYDFDFDFEE